MVLAQHALRNGQSLPKEGFRLLILALGTIEQGQVVEAESSVGVLLFEEKVILITNRWESKVAKGQDPWRGLL